MEATEKRNCEMNGQSFAHGSETCTDKECFICNEGRLEKSRDIYPEGVTPV